MATATAKELDAAYAAAAKAAGPIPNALGILRRVPGSVHYRTPPKGSADPGPSDRVRSDLLQLLTLIARRM